MLALALSSEVCSVFTYTHPVPGKERHATIPTQDGALTLTLGKKGPHLRLNGTVLLREVGDLDTSLTPSLNHTWGLAVALLRL